MAATASAASSGEDDWATAAAISEAIFALTVNGIVIAISRRLILNGLLDVFIFYRSLF